jgi:enoyl-CoA hydratase/carnithine racemase
MVFKTLKTSREGAVLFADIAAPPMNLLGPEMVRDLVSLIQRSEADNAIKVLVFKSADPDYFISHVDVTRIKQYREEAAKLTGEASIGLLFRYLSASRLVSVAQIEGRARGAGSEFVLACDMGFAARESAIFGHPEAGTGVSPGAGGMQHLTRLMGRARTLEVMLSAQDYDAELAERYGWINRALPAKELGDFVRSLAHRIAKFPAGRSRHGQGACQCDRARAGRGFPSGFGSFRRTREQTGGHKPFSSRVEARFPDPRRGNGPGRVTGPPDRRLIKSAREIRVSWIATAGSKPAGGMAHKLRFM